MRGLLQPRGDVHGVPADGVVPRLRAAPHAAHHLTGVDADADLESRAQRLHCFADAKRSTECPLGVVVVRLRCPEDRHHRVADVLLDAPAVSLDLAGYGGEVGALDLAHRLGIARLRPTGKAHQVGEEGGHEPRSSVTVTPESYCGLAQPHS